MATIIVGLIVAAVLFLAARQLYKDKKSGRSSCGGNCAGCPHACGHCGDASRLSKNGYIKKNITDR